MKTEPHPRQHHEGEPPPESLIHHAEPTLLEQWLRRQFQKGLAFWGGVALIVGGLVAAGVIAYRVGGPSRSGIAAWNELAAISVAPSALSPFGPDPNAGLPERLREIAESHPNTAAAQWAELRAASLLLNEGSAELATSRRSAGAGKLLEADDLYNRLYESARDDTLKRMAALGRARSAEARMGLNADDTDHARLDDVLALYDVVIDEFPETPEADQAERLRRRLRRSDSIAFYEQLSRFDPSSAISSPSGMDLPGLNLGPGGSGALDELFGLPPGGGSPGGSIPGLEGLNLSPSLDFGDPGATAAPDAPDMPAPIGLPDASPDTDAPAPSPTDEPAPTPAEEPSPAPAEPESPRVPEDPFGSPSPAPAPDAAPAPAEPESEPAPAPVPVDPEPAPATPDPAPAEPEPAAEPEPESPAPAGELPDEVFPSGGPSGSE